MYVSKKVKLKKGYFMMELVLGCDETKSFNNLNSGESFSMLSALEIENKHWIKIA